MSLHHVAGQSCDLCNEKLEQAHPYLKKWFLDFKSTHDNLHVSWSFRDKDSQEKAFSEGASKLHWPLSAHNHQVQGEPYSLALDIFQIDEEGRAIFNPIFCAKLNEESIKRGYTLRWGGNFKSLGDSGHFEY